MRSNVLEVKSSLLVLTAYLRHSRRFSIDPGVMGYSLLRDIVTLEKSTPRLEPCSTTLVSQNYLQRLSLG